VTDRYRDGNDSTNECPVNAQGLIHNEGDSTVPVDNSLYKIILARYALEVINSGGFVSPEFAKPNQKESNI
jgi:hypothetical protein